MVLSYARGSWQFKVANLVASSVAVAVRYGNVGGSFSGNEALVASLMAECDGKNGGNRILVAKGVATVHGNCAWQKLSRKFSNNIFPAAEVSKFDGSFLGRKGCKHLQSQKGVECTWHMLTERV